MTGRQSQRLWTLQLTQKHEFSLDGIVLDLATPFRIGSGGIAVQDNPFRSGRVEALSVRDFLNAGYAICEDHNERRHAPSVTLNGRGSPWTRNIMPLTGFDSRSL